MTTFKLANYGAGDIANVLVIHIGDDSGAYGVAAAAAALGGPQSLRQAASIDDLLQDWDRSFDALCELAEKLLVAADRRFALEGAALRARPPVLKPPKMVCHAQNYAEHVMEMRRSQFGADKSKVDMSTDFMGVKSKTWPYAFLKAPSALIGAHDEIVLAAGHTQIDWEAELALVIGRRAKRLTEGNAMSAVAGFMTFNDVSCRDNQWRPDRPTLRSDWFAAKSFDSFAPAGPYLVPAAFVGNHMNLAIRLSVNGQLVQDGNTAGLIFSPAEQLSYFSKSMTWHPGDILATGTPAGTGQGVGFFLKPGDIVECEIEGLGHQRNPCVADEEQGETL